MPGICSQGEWRSWGLGERQPQPGLLPPVTDIPPMLRRRLSSLGKMAVSASFPLLREGVNVPSVFCSRHGELERTVGLLSDLAKEEPLSPTHFSLAVHNAIGGVLSIARRDPSSITALASQEGDVSIALLEAAAIMSEQSCEEILCVVYDEPVPEVYAKEGISPVLPYAVAFLLAPDNGATNGERLSFAINERQSDEQSGVLEPQALTFLRFLLKEDSTELVLSGRRQAWRWAKQGRE